MGLQILFKTAVANARKQVQAVKTPSGLSFFINFMTLICAGLFAWLLFDTAVEKKINFLGALALIGVFFLSSGAALGFSYQRNVDPPLLRYFMTIKGASALLASVFVGFGTMATTLTFFEPRTPTTIDTNRISREVGAVDKKLSALDDFVHRRFPADPPILAAIRGRWGEPGGCALVWDLAVVRRGDAAALEARMVVRPEEQEPFRLLAEIVKAEGNRLEVVGVEPASARGRAATFVLNATTGRLAWNDRSSAAGVEEYVRCQAD